MCSLHLFLNAPVNANLLKKLNRTIHNALRKKNYKMCKQTWIWKVDLFVRQATGTFSKRPTPFRPLKTALRISRAKITRVCRVSYLAISCTYNARCRLLRLKGAWQKRNSRPGGGRMAGSSLQYLGAEKGIVNKVKVLRWGLAFIALACIALAASR